VVQRFFVLREYRSCTGFTVSLVDGTGSSGGHGAHHLAGNQTERRTFLISVTTLAYRWWTHHRAIDRLLYQRPARHSFSAASQLPVVWQINLDVRWKFKLGIRELENRKLWLIFSRRLCLLSSQTSQPCRSL